MIKSILTVAAIAMTSAPAFAEDVTSPIPAPQASEGQQPQSRFVTNALAVVPIKDNASCRSKTNEIFSKFNIGAGKENENAQWATLKKGQALVWCRNSEAVISVTGLNYDMVTKLRDKLKETF